MSENKNIQNEEELWDLLSEPITNEPKADKSKAAPKFLKTETKTEPKSEPVEAPAEEPDPAPQSEPVAEAAEKAAAPKSERKIDSFFITCMAGVAAVSVAVTLLCTSFFGGGTPSGSQDMTAPLQNGAAVGESQTSYATELELENAQLRAQLEQQKEQIKDLQNDLITLMGTEEYLANAATNPSGTNEELDAQMQALDTFAKIQEAYANFDIEKLEELIPQMDAQLSYLTPEMLNNYYLILEYVEQPSNG